MYHYMGNFQIHADILGSVDVEIATNSVVNGGLGGAVRFETKSAGQLLQSGENFGGRIQFLYGDILDSIGNVFPGTDGEVRG